MHRTPCCGCPRVAQVLQGPAWHRYIGQRRISTKASGAAPGCPQLCSSFNQGLHQGAAGLPSCQIHQRARLAAAVVPAAGNAWAQARCTNNCSATHLRGGAIRMSATQQQQSSPVAQDEHAGSHGQASGPDLTRASTEQGAAEMEAAAGGASGGTIARLRQNFNVAGVSLFLQILRGNRSLAIPHISVTDISSVNWHALQKAGFRAVIFDKDNTLTKPFEMQVESKLVESLARCKEAFGSQGIALYSNSAGLVQYDPEGHEAAALEAGLGILVLRHREKKPAGGVEEVESHFGCSAQEMVFVGDRYLTDVVFGNRHGMLTIRPAPLTTQGEPVGVALARATEDFFVARWTGKGTSAPDQVLAPNKDTLAAFVLGSSSSSSGEQQ